MQSADLDLAASMAITAAKLLERALHDDGPWYIDVGDVEQPAERIFCGDAIVFRAEFPEHCWLTRPTTAGLRCGSWLRSVKPIEHPGDAAFTVEWTLSVPLPVAV